ncbi:MAG TPA: hypothetical protein PKJ41_07855 [Bryobacteraceae bacterium]|nr:hypothetical protein [Bryobacteraceae bacterium]
MKTAILAALLLAAPLLAQDQLATELDQVARAATAMVDGDVASRIQTARSVASMLETNPRDQWAAADDYDVDHQAFITTKKTLIRLARLCSSTCDANLWLPIAGALGRIHIAIRNVNEMSQFWRWGDLHQPVPAEMKSVLETGKRVTVRKRPGMVSVLAPVYDSLGDIAGVVEVVGVLKPNHQENVQ